MKTSYKKFLKQEKTKVKLKNKQKTLLPKGQNVTDVNFKVRKIVIKGQLKDHEEGEILSARKLNIKVNNINNYFWFLTGYFISLSLDDGLFTSFSFIHFF